MMPLNPDTRSRGFFTHGLSPALARVEGLCVENLYKAVVLPLMGGRDGFSFFGMGILYAFFKSLTTSHLCDGSHIRDNRTSVTLPTRDSIEKISDVL
jgi:hypothetical protein